MDPGAGARGYVAVVGVSVAIGLRPLDPCLADERTGLAAAFAAAARGKVAQNDNTENAAK